MANLTEQSKWEDGIYQWETTDPVQGGADGIDNVPTRQLANRTQFLKALCATLAPLLSPTLSGKPTTPTPDLADSSQQIANTAFVQTLIKNAVASLVNSAPGALDTLNELAAALGNDASFATHMTNALALKAPLASPALTGTPTVPTATLDTNSTQAASTAFAWGLLNKYGLGTNDLQDWTGDLNNLTTSGLWYVVATGNAPSSNSASYFVIVLPNASGKYAVQLAMPQAAGYNELWMRTQINGGWTAWARLLSSNLLGNRQGAVAYSTDTTLTVSQFGALVSYTGTAAATFTLPTPVGNGGNSFQLWNTSAATLTLSIPAGQFLGPESTASTAATLPPNECATVISDGANYILTKSLKAPIASPALTGAPTAPTPAQFDSSTRIATMEALQRALGNYQGILNLNASTTLSESQAGYAIQFFGSGDGTLTLPLGSKVRSGGCFTFYNQSGSVLTVTTQGTDFLYDAPLLSTTNTSLQVPQGDSLIVVSRGNGEWDIVGGSAALPYAYGFRTAQMGATNVSYVSASTSLTKNDAGRAFNFAAAVTLTLPLANTVASGKVFKLRSSVAGAWVAASGSDQIYVGSNSFTNLSFAVGDTLTLMSDNGGAWIAVDGSLIPQNLAAFAFAGAPTAPTPAQFDTSNRIATMAAVQRALGNRQGSVAYSADTTLTASQFGALVSYNGTAAATFTLPTPKGYGGNGFQLWNNSAATLTLSIPAGQFRGPESTASTTATLPPNECATVISDGADYILIKSLKAPIASPALTGTPTAPTPAQFDSSTRIATMEAVQRGMGNYQAMQSFNTNTTLSETMAGYAIQFYGGSNGTFTLPLGSKVRGGGCFTLYNQSVATLTVATQGTDFLYAAPLLGSSNTSLTIPPGDSLVVASRGTGEWDVVGGSAALPYAFGFRTNKLAAVDFINVSSARTLASTDTGLAVNFLAAVAVTLPSAASVGAGKTFKFRSSVMGASVVAASNNNIALGNSVVSAVSFGNGDTLTLMSDGGSVWVAMDTTLLGTPIGTVSYYAASTPPTGWLKCNGAAISRTTYANLFAVIGTTYGAGDSSTTFNLPDLRGEFVRGWDDSRGVDSGRAIGTNQTDALRAHTHTMQEYARSDINAGSNATSQVSALDPTGGTRTTSSTGDVETRPRNVALLAMIKY